MNIRDLKYLVSVAKLKNFSKAAEQCHVSQPTLSNQIKKLEDQLGIDVFERNNKKVIITQVGTKIIAGAEEILRGVEQLHLIAQTAKDPLSGTFSLGAFPSLSTYIFPEIAMKLPKILPQLQLRLEEHKTATLLTMLSAGDLDAAFIAGPIYESGLDFVPLFEDVFYVAVPQNHPLSHQKSVAHDELSKYPVLLLEEGHCLRDQAKVLCKQYAIQELDFKATGLETLRNMVRAGTAITFIPDIAIRQDPPSDGICYIPFAGEQPSRTIGLAYRSSQVKRAIIERLVALW